MERITKFLPAWDKVDPDPDKNYGIHGVTLKMVLKGEHGAVQFVVYTNWMLPHNEDERDNRVIRKALSTGGKLDEFDLFTYKPMAADFGYHSKVPMFVGQEPMGAKKLNREKMKRVTAKLAECSASGTTPKAEDFEDFMDNTGTFDPCEYTDNGPCYYDGSGLYAREVFSTLVQKGSDAVWDIMTEAYIKQFGELK